MRNYKKNLQVFKELVPEDFYLEDVTFHNQKTWPKIVGLYKVVFGLDRLPWAHDTLSKGRVYWYTDSPSARSYL